MLIPSSLFNNNRNFSFAKFCELLGINRCAKYFVSAVENRRRYDTYRLSESGEFKIGDEVTCKAGEGELAEKNADGSVTIKLLPWGILKKYKTAKLARLRRVEPLLDYYERAQRSDVTPESDKKTIEAWFRKNVPVSPNKRDIVKQRHPVWPTQYQEAPAMHRYESMSQLWVMFAKDHNDLFEKYRNKSDNLKWTAPRVFRDNAPWEMIKAPDQSCLCVSCEDMNNLLRGSSAACSAFDEILGKVKESGDAETIEQAAILKKIKDIILMPSKLDAMVACLGDCLPSGNIEDAKYDCLYGNCDKCGFKVLWSNGLRPLLINDETEELIPNAPLSCPEWEAKNIDWRYFTHSIAPTEANRECEAAKKAASARAAAKNVVDADDDEYDEGSTKLTRNLILATKRGSAIDYLDEFEAKSIKHMVHKNIVSVEYKAKTDYEQNLRPLIASRNMDFAENLAMKDKKEVQSQYWVTIGCTIFVSIIMWLSADAWNKEDGELENGVEVTVHGEKAGEKVNMNSFWAKITDVLDGEKYEVTDSSGEKQVIDRAALRHRKKIIVAFGHITDDKKHDRHAMQHFTKKELKTLEDLMKSEYPSDIPDGRIKRLHTHSDNAGQHFKSTGAMHFFSTLPPSDMPDAAYVYSFGAPNHGKGVWDGQGGTWKRFVNKQKESSEANRKEMLHYVTGGFIKNAMNVWETLRYGFELEGDAGMQRDRQVSRTNGITHYRFLYHGPDENGVDNDPIQRPDETFRTLNQIQQQYQFAVRSEGSLYRRMRPHWCLDCMSALMEGTLEWGTESHIITGCPAACLDTNPDVEEEESNGDDDDESTTTSSQNLFTFHRCDCSKKSGPGVARSLLEETKTRDEISMTLTPGDWVANDSNQDDERIWLGKIMANPEWNGKGVYKNETRSAIRYDSGVVIPPGNIAMYIMWYEKIDILSDDLDYHISRNEVEPMVQSNEYMVLQGFDMHRVAGRSNPVPRPRSVTGQRGFYSRVLQNYQTTFEQWHNKEYGAVWKMDHKTRREALARCGMWRC